MFEFADSFAPRRRFHSTYVAIVAIMLVICLLAPVAEPHGASAMTSLEASNANQNQNGDNGQPTSDYSDPNVVTNAFVAIGQGVGQAAKSTEVGLLRASVGLTKGVTIFDRGIKDTAFAVAGFTASGVSKTVAFTGKAADGVANLVSYPFHHHPKLSNLSAIIQPPDNTPTPTITQLRAQQAAIIQQGTENLSTPPPTSGSGGACDAGMGNGGYPMQWCNAPMDTIRTVSYSYEAINRECTSYAYWYFTSVEGHTDFHVTDDAKYWAGTSNYPTHATPVVGAIAVETAGAYGHVAIVQALAGQTYDGQAVPAGYVLVSEMNYDWNGHFRYSYSPMSKFTSYIYP